MKKSLTKPYPKPVYILGINEALGASAALLKDGRIVAAALEERFTRIKNNWGFPINAIRFCCEHARIKPADLDLVVLSYQDPYPHFTSNRAEEKPDAAPPVLRYLRNMAPTLEYKFPFLSLFTDTGRKLYYKYIQPHNKIRQINEISHALSITKEKIIFLNHHLAHAYTAYYSISKKAGPALVLTCDGAGDHLCTSVSIVRKGVFKRISKTSHIHSLGLFYASITSHLGLKAHEDEYKVMGLAPYGETGAWQNTYKIFQQLFWVEGLEFKSRIPARHFDFFLNEHLQRTRFDHIATAAQKFLEDILVQWIKNAVNRTKIRNVAVSGGVFLNVKANQKTAGLREIKNISFTPSPGDDTNAFGACYYGYNYLTHSTKIQPLTNLFLGPGYSESDIKQSLKTYDNFHVSILRNINKSVARLLARGEIVARFKGEMEFGARALGNRSILADPRNRDVVEKINQMIKMRDFWMPFAPTILDKFAKRYLVKPNKTSSPYMMVGFQTTEIGKQQLAAAIHPFDKSVRPQILTEEMNPDYYDLIEEFFRLTGIGAVLNTSFNIHGEPIVCSPQDALSTFARSGLKYLQLENFLISK